MKEYPIWERRVAGFVCMHTKGEIKHVGCAVLISQHQEFHKLIVWEGSNNCTPKADIMLPKQLFVHCQIKPCNSVISIRFRKVTLLSNGVTKVNAVLLCCLPALSPHLPADSHPLSAAVLVQPLPDAVGWTRGAHSIPAIALPALPSCQQ